MLSSRVEKVSDDVANLSNETPMFNDNISVKQQAALKEIVSDHESLAVPINPATLSPQDVDEKFSMALLSGSNSNGIPNEQI